MKITSGMFFGVIFLCVFWIFTWSGNVLDKTRGTNSSNSLFISNKIAQLVNVWLCRLSVCAMLQTHLNIDFGVESFAEILQEILYMYIKAPRVCGVFCGGRKIVRMDFYPRKSHPAFAILVCR